MIMKMIKVECEELLYACKTLYNSGHWELENNPYALDPCEQADLWLDLKNALDKVNGEL